MSGVTSTPATDTNSERYTFSLYYIKNATNTFIENFPGLAKSEKWDEIMTQGNKALVEMYVKRVKMLADEAKISAWLTSTCF